jgi:hypothetical protein
MANFYSVLPGLQPSQQDILQAELLAKQILEAAYPDMDLREGTGLRDLVLRPSAMLLAVVRAGIDYYFAQNTIQGVDDTTPTSIVDNILSNWFITRNLGTRAVINARLYFARQKNVSLTTDIYFSTDNVSKFFPQAAVTFASGSLTYDAFQNEYYVDVDLIAEAEGTQYNIGSGSLLYFSNFDPYFLHAEINYLKDSSVSSETNEEFITRAETAISTRNLINDPSITANLQNNFNYLNQIVSIGMGDPEMIRDQIQAVFTGQLPQLITQLTSSGTTATATLANHGYNSGQTVTIAGGAPTTYNGSYTITVVDTSHFTYQMATAATNVTVLPTIQAVNSPLLIHNGGMVDVYCGNTIASSVVQLTTDAFGNADLTGAVYSFSRSSVAGGSSDDTIPVNATISATSATIAASSGLVHVSSVQHGLSTGQTVMVSGIAQTLPIASISCSGITVTVVSTGHGLTNGTSVTISGVTPTTYNGTYTITVIDANTFIYFVAFNIASAGTGSPMLIGNPSISGTFSVNVTSANAFDIVMPGLWTSGSVTTTNAAVIQYAVPYTVTNKYTQSQLISAMTCSGTTVTVTVPNHGITSNRYVTITGATTAGFNGTWLISNALNKDQFQFTVPVTISGPAGNNAVVNSVIPWNDYGFSSRQDLVISFGSLYANQTASFTINYFDNVDSVQSYLENSTNRVLCGDLLARGFNFYLLDLTVTAYNGTTPDATVITDTVKTFLATMNPGDTLIVSNLTSSLNTAGITNIKTPIGINYTHFTRDLITPTTGSITDFLDPNDRTNIFILNTVTTNNQTV